MTWRRLALKNILFNLWRYIGYLASSSLAVMVYFMFSAFTLNSYVIHGYMPGTARYVMGGCEYVVLVFAVFFILFFHSALIRSRGKEFGLLRVLGIGSGQVWGMVFGESILLGLLAMATGTALGVIFLKLFLMAIGRILELPDTIPFQVPKRAVLSTVILFAVLFLVEGAIIASRTALRTPKTLLFAQRLRQTAPRSSWMWVAAGVVALAVAYYLAVARSRAIMVNFFPILILTSAGTYLLFSQAAVYVLNLLRRRPVSGTTLLVTGRFAHRVKDNARVLTVVTLLSAVVMTSMGAVLGLNSIIHQNSTRLDPFAIMVVHRNTQPLRLTVDDVRTKLNGAGTPASQVVRANVITATVYGESKDIRTNFILVSSSTFEHVRQILMRADPELRPYLEALPAPQRGHANVYAPYPLTMPSMFMGNRVRIAGVADAQFVVNGQSDVRIFNEQTGGGLPDFVLELSDADYDRIAIHLPITARYTVCGFVVPRWAQTKGVVQALKSQLPVSERMYLTDRVTADEDTKQMLSVVLFAGIFISALFLLACVSSIYFRIQTQYESDRHQYLSLLRIGMQRQEMGRVVTAELLLFFCVPVAVALVHSTFAMVDFSHLLVVEGSVWRVFFTVAGIYLMLTAVAFLIAKAGYLKRLAGDEDGMV